MKSTGALQGMRRTPLLPERDRWRHGTQHPPVCHKAALITRDAVPSHGKALDPATRAFMETRLDYDFSNVRVHTDSRAGEAAAAVHARAFALGRDIYFRNGDYDPESRRGRYLLAHELAHVAQQENAGSGAGVEEQANAAAAAVVEGRTAAARFLGGAGHGLLRQPTGSEEEAKKKSPKMQNEAKIDLSPRKAAETKAEFLPTPAAPKGEAKQPEMPSRIPIPWLSSGRFSLGVRLGFPELPGRSDLQERLLGGSPDSLKLSLARAKIMDQMLTGKVPTAWEELDNGVLAKAVWGIFSQNIAPDLARKITSGLTVSSTTGGLSYELDAVLITDFSKQIGGGISLTLRW